MINAPKGALNTYLQMEGLSPSPRLFGELMRGWSGFTLTGGEADVSPDELARGSEAGEPQGLGMELSILSPEPAICRRMVIRASQCEVKANVKVLGMLSLPRPPWASGASLGENPRGREI